jgi:hypothetical protein
METHGSNVFAFCMLAVCVESCIQAPPTAYRDLSVLRYSPRRVVHGIQSTMHWAAMRGIPRRPVGPVVRRFEGSPKDVCITDETIPGFQSIKDKCKFAAAPQIATGLVCQAIW